MIDAQAKDGRRTTDQESRPWTSRPTKSQQLKRPAACCSHHLSGWQSDRNAGQPE